MMVSKLRPFLVSYLLQFLVVSTIHAEFAYHPRYSNETIGVGIDFTLDYVTSAASLPNGTTIPLVQVPGSPEYKALMRHWHHMCEAVHNGTRSLDDIE
jgi:hypothetical protein